MSRRKTDYTERSSYSRSHKPEERSWRSYILPSIFLGAGICWLCKASGSNRHHHHHDHSSQPKRHSSHTYRHLSSDDDEHRHHRKHSHKVRFDDVPLSPRRGREEVYYSRRAEGREREDGRRYTGLRPRYEGRGSWLCDDGYRWWINGRLWALLDWETWRDSHEVCQGLIDQFRVDFWIYIVMI